MSRPDFNNFLKNISNPSLTSLESNEAYDDVMGAVADMFGTIYDCMEGLKITTTYDMTYEDLNMNVVNMVSHYLNTDHLKDTLFTLMRLWQEKHAPFTCESERDYVTLDGEYVLLHGERIWIGALIEDFLNDPGAFVKKEVMKSFLFFIKNSGSLHKSKGIKPLLERLIEFYGAPNCIDKSFNGIHEHQLPDIRNMRMDVMTSVQGIVNLSNIEKTNELDLTEPYSFTQYLELKNYKYCILDNQVFMSYKKRDDWYFLTEAEELYSIGEDFLVVKFDRKLIVYREDFEIYLVDDGSYSFIEPVPSYISGLSSDKIIDFIPQIVNKKNDTDIYENVLYFIERDTTKKRFSLKQIRYDSQKNKIYEEYVIEKLRISDDPAFFGRGTDPKKIIFDVTSLYVNKENDIIDIVYLFTMDYIDYDYVEETDSYTLKSGQFLCLARDDNTDDEQEVLYRIIDKIVLNQSVKIEMVERIINPDSAFDNLLEKYKYGTYDKVLDIIYPKRTTIFSDFPTVFEFSVSIAHKLVLINSNKSYDSLGIDILSLPKTYLDIPSMNDILYIESNPQQHFDDYPVINIVYRKDGFIYMMNLWMNQFSKKATVYNIHRILRNYPDRESLVNIDNYRISKNHIYCCISIDGPKEFTKEIVSIDNMDYLLNKDFISKNMSLSYDVKVNKITTESQKYFDTVRRISYTHENRFVKSLSILQFANDEQREEYVMSQLVDVYKPINVINKGLFPKVDLGQLDRGLAYAHGILESTTDNSAYNQYDKFKIHAKIKLSDSSSYIQTDTLVGEKLFIDDSGIPELPEFCEESEICGELL